MLEHRTGEAGFWLTKMHKVVGSFLNLPLATCMVFLLHKKASIPQILGGGFKYLLFSPLLGEDSHFD